MAGPSLTRCGAIARGEDPDRYLCALFAPSALREDLFTLIAFNAAVASTRERVSEPVIGQMRLQWWRDALDGIDSGTPRRHEVVTPLADLMARHGLARAPFDRLIDAREADLEDSPFETMADLRRYARESSVPLALVMADVLGVTEEGARARVAAVAEGYALVGLLRATVHLARSKRVVLPVDLLRRHGVRTGDLFELRGNDGLGAAVGEIAAIAEGLLAPAPVGARAKPVLLPSVLARRAISVLKRHGFDVLRAEVVQDRPGRVWSLWWASLRGRC